MSKATVVTVGLRGRDQLRIAQSVHGYELRAVGCSEFLRGVEVLRQRLAQQPLDQIQWLERESHADLLCREALLKLQGRWQPSYSDQELCHCRVVSTESVQAAIVCGATSVEQVGRRTAAGTGCGTCRADIQKLLEDLSRV